MKLRNIVLSGLSCAHILKKNQLKRNKIWKSTSEQNIFYFELSSKNNVGILGITVSMWEKHDLETIFTSNDVMNIQDGIRNGFSYR